MDKTIKFHSIFHLFRKTKSNLNYCVLFYFILFFFFFFLFHFKNIPSNFPKGIINYLSPLFHTARCEFFERTARSKKSKIDNNITCINATVLEFPAAAYIPIKMFFIQKYKYIQLQ